MWRVLVVRSVATLLPLVACLNLRRERRHPTLERAKHDLLYRCTIRRRAAKQGTTIRVPTLSGDEVAFRVGPRASVDEFSHLLEGYGMPIKGGATRGDLRVFVQVR